MLPWLPFEPHMLGLAILYNQMTVGTTDINDIAKAISYGVLTPERGSTPLTSGAREQYGRALKAINPKLRLAAYVTLNGGMVAAKGAFSNQPFHDNELGPLLVKHPDLVMRDEAGAIIYKGGNDLAHRMAVTNPGYAEPILDNAHARNFREIKARAGDLYEDGFVDDVTDKFIAFEREPAIIKTRQYGDPFGDAFYKAHYAWHKRLRDIILSYGFGYAFNMGGGNDRIEERIVPHFDMALPEANGVPGLAMLEYFYFNNNGTLNVKHMDANMRKAWMIAERGGRQLLVCRVDPRTVQPGMQRENEMRAAVVAAQIVNGGNGTYMRWAKNYTEFADVAFVHQIGMLTGKPKAGVAGEPRRIAEGRWERAFENMTLRVDATTGRYEMIESPIIIEPEKPASPQTGYFIALDNLGRPVPVNLRATPSTASPPIAVLRNGDKVTLYPDRITANGFTFAKCDAVVSGVKMSGWMAKGGADWSANIAPTITKIA